jgi:hypothetical protein
MTSRRLRSSCLALALCLAPVAASAAGECRFPKRPPVTLKNMGPCQFDVETSSFAGDAVEQARCLVTPVRTGGYLNQRLEKLPPAFQDYVGNAKDMPGRDALRALLRERGLEDMFGPGLSDPVSHAHDNDPNARGATYFVIHDTSSPNFGRKPWPVDIDGDLKLNRLLRYACSNKIERAHTFINRSGEIFYPHDFSRPWRATKFETATNFVHALRGLFLHNELIQPRQKHPGFRGRNDFKAPEPGFSTAQYDALALVYVVASVRAGFWMIPAYHAVLDEGIYDKHDDPQNFDLDAFADSLTRLRAALKEPAKSVSGG